MTQVPAHFETNPSPVDPAEVPPFSLAAITSLVFSLLFCIPGLAVLGLLCGVVGIFTTSGGARRGRGMAITGVVLSVLVVGVYVTGVSITVPWIAKGVAGTEKFARSGPQDALKAAFAGEIQVVQDHFMNQSTPSKEDILAFTSAATTRWGAFQGSIDARDMKADGPSGNDFKVSLKLTFESAVVPAEALLTVGDTESSQLKDLAIFQPHNDFDSFILIDQIRIEPETGEVLELGSGMGSAKRANPGPKPSSVEIKIEGEGKTITVKGNKENVTVIHSDGKTEDDSKNESEGGAGKGSEPGDGVSGDDPGAGGKGDS